MKISAAAQATVEILLKRRKKDSLRCGRKCLTKSIVETEARDVRAELTEDIAAERMATIRKPFRICGTSVIMKMGNSTAEGTRLLDRKDVEWHQERSIVPLV